MGQMLSIIVRLGILCIVVRWLLGKGDDKKKPRGKPPVISPPSLTTCRDYTLQTNLRTNPPPPPISSSLGHSKTSGASSLQPTLQVTHHQTREVVGKMWYDYRYYEEEDELEELKLIIEVKWIKHYSSEYKILLVGEGDFSFSASLALAFASAKNITATSLDSIEFLSRNYNRALPNIHRLQSLGASVMHGVDATQMANVFPFKCMLFDRVIYNFPLAGFFRERREDQISRNQKLILLFLENAKKMIKMDGEIHITHKSNGFFREWNLELVASTVGLRLIEEVPFFLRDYPGYNAKYGFGGDKNFDCVPSKTYRFGLKKPIENRFLK